MKRARSLLALMHHVQAHLEDDLGLDALAGWTGLSPGHLQRAFKAVAGESPKRYVSRLRVERAAFRLAIQDATVLEIALDSGFANPDTFARAFRRRYDATPTEYRSRARRERRGALRAVADASAIASLSRTRIVRLRPAHLACIRHVGPYEAVPGALWDRLDAWVRARRLAAHRVWLGIGHDAPGATAPEHLRFDAAVVVTRPFESEADVAYRHFEGGEYALTSHVGPFAALPAAYAVVAQRTLALPRHELVGLPAVEFYRVTRVDVALAMNVTEICLPLRVRAAPRTRA